MTNENTLAGLGRDITKDMLPRKNWLELAEDLFARFPGTDWKDVLTRIVATQFYEMRYGNKREERAACEMLNLVQVEAIKQRNRKVEKENP